MPRGGWNSGVTKNEAAASLLMEALKKGEVLKKDGMRMTGLSSAAFDSLVTLLTFREPLYERQEGKLVWFGLMDTRKKA